MNRKVSGVYKDGEDLQGILSGSVELADARRLLGLLLEVWERRDDARQWRQCLLEGMCPLVGAKVGVVCNTSNHGPGGRTKLDHLVDTGWNTAAQRKLYMGKIRSAPLADPLAAALINAGGRSSSSPSSSCSSITVMREEVLPDDQWYGHPDVQTVYMNADVNHAICWMHFGSEAGTTISVRLLRPWKSDRFTRREVALLDLAGSHLSRLYQYENQARAAAPQLSPRARQTLLLLQRGKSEHEIAEQLSLSPHTVHDYIKEIYRTYKVGSRRELLARFIRRSR